jgi:hypothetical protein
MRTYIEELYFSDLRAEERRSFFAAQHTRRLHLFAQSAVASLLWLVRVR